MLDSIHVGPLPETIVDFWRLVWQEKPPTIVVLTNLMEGKRVKCQQYWPEIGAEFYGPFQITVTDQQILADYTIRSFLVQVCVWFLSVRLAKIPCIYTYPHAASRQYRLWCKCDSVPLHSVA